MEKTWAWLCPAGAARGAGTAGPGSILLLGAVALCHLCQNSGLFQAAGRRSEQCLSCTTRSHSPSQVSPCPCAPRAARRQPTLINPNHVNYPTQAPCFGDPTCRNVPLDQAVTVTTGSSRHLPGFKGVWEWESEPVQGDVHIWDHRGTAHVSQAVC